MGLAPLYKCNGNDNDSGASPATTAGARAIAVGQDLHGEILGR